MNLRVHAQWVLPGLLAMALLLSPPGVTGKTKDGKESTAEKGEKVEKQEQGPKIQRVPNNVYENLRNNVSNIDYYTTNYGIFGLNILGNRAGGIWPRGQSTPYIFGGGIWFGTRKVAKDSAGNIIKTVDGLDSLRKQSVISYNPNSGASWMSPGRVGPDALNSPVDNSAAGIDQYRIYYSTDYSKQTGEPFDLKDRGSNWPIWDTKFGDSLKVNRYFGEYVEDVTRRTLVEFPKGPAIISGEDVFTTYKDTDLSRYEIAQNIAKRQGYPIGIQVEQTDYSWGFGDYANFMFLKYLIINKSSETLLNCWMAPAMDMDIGNAANDRTKIAIEDPFTDSLNLAVQWSETEPSRYGYIGFDFLESPAVDSLNFVRSDKRVYTEDEQLGLKTFRNWTIQNDPITPEERYDFMSDLSRDGDTGPGDKRFLMATGPFNLRPGDTARIVVGMMFAYGAGSGVPTGLWPDMQPLIALDTFAQKVYNENFLAPTPPDQANLSWTPLSNGVKLTWNERSERSLDFQERGLDFKGYVIQRQRRGSPNAVVPTDTTVGWNLNWKTIGGFQIPNMPDSALRVTAARQNNPSLLGSWSRLPMLMDTVAGTGATFYKYFIYCLDTLRRPARIGVAERPDTVIRTLCDSAIGVRNVVFAFDPFNDRDATTRDVVRDAIAQIMDSVTNGRTFIDVGDDNGNGEIDENSVDLAQNEKLINNVYYYYQLLSYDAGSPAENTPPKFNTGIDGLNRVRTTPEAPSTGLPVTTTVIPQDGLGGIHHFRLMVLDQDRLGQLFGGDTLEFEFQPTDLGTTGGFVNYFYASEVIVRRRSTGEELTRFFVDYESKFTDRTDSLYIGTFPDGRIAYLPLDSSFATYNSINAAGDTVFLDRRGLRVPINGSFTSSPDRPVYGSTTMYKATFGINFDYSFVQFGDSMRFGRFDDTNRVLGPVQPFTNPSSDVNLIGSRQYTGLYYPGNTAYIPNRFRIPSIGQVKLEVEFAPGGTETLTFDKSGNSYTFANVPYLTINVRNIAGYSRSSYDENGNVVSDSISYNYVFPPDPFAELKADTTASETVAPLPRQITPGTHALYSYGWLNRPDDSLGRGNRFRRSSFLVNNRLGEANRYYLSANDGQGNTLHFTNRLLVNGAEILLDFAGMANYKSDLGSAGVPSVAPSNDFDPGDKFIVDFTGGAIGLPQPGAKVLVAVSKPQPTLIDSTSGRDYTDNLLDQITVVPNPYRISHEGQVANSDRLLYFTRLPEICTIEIYTAEGELLRTLDHRASIADGRVAVNAWDMLTKSGRQVQSQLLIARITTPNGAETIKKFAVVVGGFRIFSR